MVCEDLGRVFSLTREVEGLKLGHEALGAPPLCSEVYIANRYKTAGSRYFILTSNFCFFKFKDEKGNPSILARLGKTLLVLLKTWI